MHSDSLRTKRRLRAEEAAAKEEQIKMLSTQLQLLMAQLVKMMKEMEKAGKIRKLAKKKKCQTRNSCSMSF